MTTTSIEGIILETLASFNKETYVEVPLEDGLSVESLTEGDPDPIFVTLPIGKVDVVSRNARKYPQEAVQEIVDTINQETSIGQKGHLRDSERPYVFDIPPLMWVGATLEADGMAYGKAYIMQHASDVREYVRLAKRANAKIATSIYGTAEVDGDGVVSNLHIESIDLAHPGRIGVPIAQAVPTITQETITPESAVNTTQAETNNNSQEEEIQMPTDKDGTEKDPIVDLETKIDTLKESHREALREKEQQLAEQLVTLNTFNKIATALGDPGSVLEAVTTLKTQVADLQRENQALLETTITGEVKEAVKVESRQPVIIEMVTSKKPTTRAEVKEALEDVLNRESVKALLREGVAETMGPAQERPISPVNETQGETLIIIPGA